MGGMPPHHRKNIWETLSQLNRPVAAFEISPDADYFDDAHCLSSRDHRRELGRKFWVIKMSVSIVKNSHACVFDASTGARSALHFYSLSALAARMKSLSVSPSILCVQMVSRTRPQAR